MGKNYLACLLLATHMTNVTRDMICLIYDLMRDNVDVNVESVILSGMKKARLNLEHKYGFGGLVTRFLCN